MKIIERVLFHGSQTPQGQEHILRLYLDQIIEYDLQNLFEMCFSSENYGIIEKALKVYGQLLIADDDVALEIFKKFPHIHRLIVQNIFVNINLTPISSALTS